MENPNDKPQHGRQFATQMDETLREQLLQQQTECTFIWQAKQGATGTIMSFLWAKEALWLTTNDSRPRVAALRRHPRATAVVSSAGTMLGNSRCVTVRGPCQVLDDRHTKDWFFPAFCQKLFPENFRAQETMKNMLDREGQIILQIQPEKITGYDGDALMQKIAS